MEFKFSGMKRGEFGEEKWGEGKRGRSQMERFQCRQVWRREMASGMPFWGSDGGTCPEPPRNAGWKTIRVGTFRGVLSNPVSEHSPSGIYAKRRCMARQMSAMLLRVLTGIVSHWMHFSRGAVLSRPVMCGQSMVPLPGVLCSSYCPWLS